MGAQLVGAAFAVMQGIPADDLAFPARLALLRMAHTARDDDERPTYWAGWQPLALAIGYGPDVLDWSPTDSRSQTASRRVRRALGQLVDAGLICRVGRDGNDLAATQAAHPGHRQRYRLNLSAAVDNPTGEGPRSGPSRSPQAPHPGHLRPPIPVTSGPPKEQGGRGRRRPGPDHQSQRTVTRARARGRDGR